MSKNNRRRDLDLDLKYRIARLLDEREETVASMGRALGLPYGTVVTTCSGYRRNPETQERIAGYLGLSREELFGSEGQGSAC